MVWNLHGEQGNEAGKVLWELVPYTRGRVLDIGCGKHKAFPHFIGVDNYADEKLFGHEVRADIRVETAERLEMFADQSVDAVFSSHLLEHIKPERVAATLSEWCRVVKDGGYLILYLPDEDEYPKVGEPGANPDHKWNVSKALVIEAMSGVRSWDLIRFEKRNAGTEYSLLFVFKIGGGELFFSCEKPRPEKTVAVVRYGAFGDAIQVSSILPGLKEQGFHVTVYTVPRSYEVIKNDPHIDEFIIQDPDQVPNYALGHFWENEAKKYDRFINLSESVEGTFLAVPGRMNHRWPQNLRHKHMNVNYTEFMHDMAGVPMPGRQKFYPLADEIRRAEETFSKLDGPVIVWSLAGSSVHKTWPYLDQTIARTMLTYPKAHVMLLGDDLCQILECGWEKEPRVHKLSGKWSIRESLTFATHCADLVIGSETGIMNAVALCEMPKIITLSHSSAENLTKHWVNCTALSQPITSPVPCAASACHLMHYNFDHCHRDDATGVAACQANINADTMWIAIVQALRDHHGIV